MTAGYSQQRGGRPHGGRLHSFNLGGSIATALHSARRCACRQCAHAPCTLVELPAAAVGERAPTLEEERRLSLTLQLNLTSTGRSRMPNAFPRVKVHLRMRGPPLKDMGDSQPVETVPSEVARLDAGQ